MFKSLFSKLWASYLGVILVTLGTTGVLISYSLSAYYFRVAEEDLLERGQKIAAEIAPLIEAQKMVELTRRVGLVGLALNARVCVFDESGQALVTRCEFDTPPPRLDEIEEDETTRSATGTGRLYYQDEPILWASVPILNPTTGATLGQLRIHRPLVGLRATTARARGLIGSAALVAIVIAAGLSLGLSNTISRPLRAMRRLAGRLAEGDFEVRLEVASADEVGQLARSFNDLAAALQRTISDLNQEQSKMLGILTSMSDGVLAVNQDGAIILVNPQAERLLELDGQAALSRPLAETIHWPEVVALFRQTLASGQPQVAEFSLATTRQTLLAHAAPIQNEAGDTLGAVGVFHDVSEARRLEQLRRQFVADVSHELRTPLTSMQGFVGAMLDGTITEPEERDRYLRVIREETQRLTRLVHDLLDLSRMEAGDQRLDLETLDVGDLLAQVARRFEAQAAAQQVEIRVQAPAEPLLLSADPDRLDQVVANLLDNAIRFNRPAGQVVLSATANGNFLEVQVRDTGIGIPPEDLPHIWERFHRVDKSRARGQGGTGLGLAIVKRIIEAHGGTVTAESVVNEGTTIRLRLPR